MLRGVIYRLLQAIPVVVIFAVLVFMGLSSRVIRRKAPRWR